MSSAFRGAHWKGTAFKTSQFRGLLNPSGSGFWFGANWLNSLFETTHFRGILLDVKGKHWKPSHFRPSQFTTKHFRGPRTPVAGHHWKNLQFKNHQFATRHFRGIGVPVVPPKPTEARGAGGGRMIGPSRAVPIRRELAPVQRDYDLELVGAALLELEQDF